MWGIISIWCVHPECVTYNKVSHRLVHFWWDKTLSQCYAEGMVYQILPGSVSLSCRLKHSLSKTFRVSFAPCSLVIKRFRILGAESPDFEAWSSEDPDAVRGVDQKYMASRLRTMSYRRINTTANSHRVLLQFRASNP